MCDTSCDKLVINNIRYDVPTFDSLETSTMTVMCYTNVTFNFTKIFNSINITPINVRYTKKQRNIDKKSLIAPYGAIISVQSKTQIRGLDLRKKGKKWCNICRPTVIDSEGKEKKVLTINEYLSQVPSTDIYNIMQNCSRCNKNYYPREQRKINHFLNQLTFVLSLSRVPMLNIMMFKDNFKIAGCKSIDDAQNAVRLLWNLYISKVPEGYTLTESIPRFAFEIVMRNVDFKLGFFIDRRALNNLMNSKEFSDKVHMSQFESTGHTNVNIKMFSIRPDNFHHPRLSIFNEKEDIDVIPTIPYKRVKKKKAEYATFIVFSSSEIILSGRYEENMRDIYNFFISTIFNNRSNVEEMISSKK